jgi:hypothetical protein
MKTTIEEIEFYLKIPQRVLRSAHKQLTSTEFEVFLFLSEIANFKKDSPDYSFCRPTFKEIEEGTGVSAGNMKRHMDKLKKKGFININYQNHWNRTKGFATSHKIQVLWLKSMRDDIRINKTSRQT